MTREGLSRRNPNEGKKDYSIIHWQTGEPKSHGRYLVQTEQQKEEEVIRIRLPWTEKNNSHFN